MGAFHPADVLPHAPSEVSEAPAKAAGAAVKTTAIAAERMRFVTSWDMDVSLWGTGVNSRTRKKITGKGDGLWSDDTRETSHSSAPH
ncbi:hypothetical protein STIAU_1580 [Stigmatella aurantiaca DW4/3-1]|uniref:Uncharacterized protein n=1 Tax=Stigmatella aurantiaca (strain DW4/3-1) TaxID=378806 RepID=Q09DA7_STIAD|nr:hypothetical protein STIAU_1580 [Stigmatella aurantiaca DW4/3-1]